MAYVNLDVTNLNNSEVDGIGTLIENFLKEKFHNKGIEVDLQDKELDEDDDEDKE